MKRYSAVEFFTEREIKLRKYIRKQQINENTHTCSISSVLTPKFSKGSPRPAVFLAAPIVVKELRRKEDQKKGSRYERINTIYMLTYLFRPLAHMSKRRARFDVGCLKAWW